MAKTFDERCTELDQQIRRLQKEKQRLLRKQKDEEKKHRDHVLIVTGAHLLTHFPGAEERLLEMTDDEIRAWVDGRFRTRDAGGN